MQEPSYNPESPMGTYTMAYQHPLTSSPTHTAVGMLVEYPPNGATPPHRHGGACVSAFVLQGSVLIKMNDEPARVVPQGGSWYEAPGCHHRISTNASATEPASFFVNFVVESEVLKREGVAALLQYDAEWVDIVAQKTRG
ncbi:hypothetical protein C7974DRAFT_184610 [Boeremia exigua]|uniref:uncharacterized protein n=1 Tax=Boeremia exigua TaxID=749465 RepID=UPI001E8E6586|nr:uncharacterized protein C7974DRAFT_184610 [Boeremia exigua]KAH6629321.1 hypothetical protein C7974DRAFT_184610 [Boeremia exigua]